PPEPAPEPTAAEPPRPAPRAATRPAEISAAEVALAEVEAQFLALDAPADAPARAPLWVEMGELNSRLGRRFDAGLCWTRALWEAGPDTAAQLADRWAAAESGLVPSSEAPLPWLLARTTPTVDETRALASQLMRARHFGGVSE